MRTPLPKTHVFTNKKPDRGARTELLAAPLSEAAGQAAQRGVSRRVPYVTGMKALLATMLCTAMAMAGGVAADVSYGATAHRSLGTIEEGVPESSGEALVGPFSGVNSLTIDSGHLWVAESIDSGLREGRSRVDEFNADGTYVPGSQLHEEGGVENISGSLAVGGEGDVFVTASKEFEGVVAVYGTGPGAVLQGVWKGAHTAAKAFGEAVSIAVSHNLETNGEVVIATNKTSHSGAMAVDVYAGGSGGTEPAAPLSELTGTPSGLFVRPDGVAVGPNGELVVVDGEFGLCAAGAAVCTVDVFDPVPGMPGHYEFAFQLTPPPGEPFKIVRSVAVGPEGHIFLPENKTRVVEEFSSSGNFMTSIAGVHEEAFGELPSIGVDSESNVYVGNYDPVFRTGAIDVFGPDENVPTAKTEAPDVQIDEVGEVTATLEGKVDPEGFGPATCDFVWGATKAFGQDASCKEGVANGNAFVSVTATVSHLLPDSTYTTRLRAANANGVNVGGVKDNVSFPTPGPGIHGEWASKLASTSATLNAAIDPNNSATSYYFQYGTGVAYEATVPSAPNLVGAGKGDVRVTPQHIQGLAPGTTYHFRVVAVSQIEVEGSTLAVTVPGPDLTFTTQGSAIGSGLADGRRWELVSPPDKHGSQLKLGAEGGLAQASAAGQGVTFIGTLPTEESVKGFLYLGVQVIAGRGADGWTSQDISLPHATSVGLPLGVGDEYRFFSPTLASAIVEPIGEFLSLSPEVFPPDTDRTPYIRHNATCLTTPGACYRPLLLGCPAEPAPCEPSVAENADVPAGTKFGGSPAIEKFVGEARFRDATADASCVILSGRVPLTVTAAGATEELYEWCGARAPAEQLQLVSALPANAKGEQLPAIQPKLGANNTIMRHAVSEDGSRTLWSAEAPGGQHLYMRDTASGTTLQLDVPAASCVSTGLCGDGAPSPEFQLASADASRVLFLDKQHLTANAGKTPGTADLYECRIEEGVGGPVCALTDLTPAPKAHEAAAVRGLVIGASEDASWVYFVANGVLGDAAERGATAGDCNFGAGGPTGACHLYVYHEGTTHLVAEVAGDDFPDWEGNKGEFLPKTTARVTPNGQWLAFMSDRSLTGYDNRDVNTGEPDEEVFLYHVEGENPTDGKVICASCDPTGARPAGVPAGQLQLVNGGMWPAGVGLAASVPGWEPYEVTTALYQPRYLTNEGRLFFDSPDALVSQDDNNSEEVYEFEPAGIGSCTPESAAFNQATRGCVTLISSGQGPGEAAFADASENGDDVFFLTAGRLVPGQDKDTAIDLYDAHVCSAAVPCIERPAESEPCRTAESCRSGIAPAPGVFGPPASATFHGPGNVTPGAPPATKPKAKPTRAQALSKALQSCRKRFAKAKKRRAGCERQARARYSSHKAARAGSSKRGGR